MIEPVRLAAHRRSGPPSAPAPVAGTAEADPAATALLLAARARDSLDRCALRAQLRGDPMLGTAFPAARVLLVEQPGAWGRGGLRESRFDSSVATQLETTLGRRGVRVLAMRRPGRTAAEARRRWAFADCRPGRERMVWGDYAADTDLLSLDPDSVEGVEEVGASFFVCAHSKHDTCCALRGRPVAAALDAVRPGRAWECSHVGGERFAANVLVLPLGLLYGRVLPFAAADFADAADAGEVVPALLRGRVGLVPVAQAALAFVHSQFALPKAHDATVHGVRMLAPEQAAIVVRTPQGELEVTVALEQRPAHRLTCTAHGASPYVAYRPVRMSLVSSALLG